MADTVSFPTRRANASHAHVGGAWVVGEDGFESVVDPATAEPIVTVSLSSIQQCRSAVDAAADAQAAWGARAPRDRAQILIAAYELMITRSEDLARLITAENGKALADARAEVAYAAEFFRWFSEEAVRIPGEFRTAPSGANWILVSHEPIGVALLVTPWNFPAAMATRKIAPALAAGCTVVLKPALETPLTALLIAEILAEAGVPDGVVNVVLPSPAGPAVKAMLDDRRVRALSFTGSTEVGKILLRECATTVTKPSMELGGNAPFIVLDDADLDAAVDGFMLAKFRNGGSACTAANRIFVQRAIADRFVAEITARAKALRMGPGDTANCQIGAMVSEGERDRVAALVDEAVAQGARILCGGEVPTGRGWFYPPTVLDNVAPDSAIARTEIFGPVAVIIRFDDVDQVVGWANDSEAGLVSYLYTEGLERGLAVTRRLESGMVGLNRGLVSDPAAPFGGSKHSGLGREGSSEGLLEFMEMKYTAVPRV